MSDFVFYAQASMGCVCILLLLLYSIKKLPTPELKFNLYYNLVLWHILYFTSDSIWSLVSDGVLPENLFSVLAITYSNAIIDAFLFYSRFVFAEISTRPEMTRSQIRRLRLKLKIPIFVEAVLLLASLIVTPNFWLDENLDPKTYFYLVQMFIPGVYILTVTIRGIARGFKPQNRKNLRIYLIVASYTPGCIVAAAAQLFYSLTAPMFCFWCTMILLFIYLTLQNQLISTDPLTELNNRNQLHRYLQMQRESKDHYIIMVDVDQFKQINDTYGHIEGDRALELVSKALKNACDSLGKTVFLCRYGGDEFLMIVPTEMPAIAIRVIKDCMKEEVSNQYSSLNFALKISLGYALWDGKSSNFKQSVAEADRMMYEDKRS
jgi:diguanylate cyclase (GGDEF)-like protein